MENIQNPAIIFP